MTLLESQKKQYPWSHGYCYCFLGANYHGENLLFRLYSIFWNIMMYLLKFHIQWRMKYSPARVRISSALNKPVWLKCLTISYSVNRRSLLTGPFLDQLQKTTLQNVSHHPCSYSRIWKQNTPHKLFQVTQQIHVNIYITFPSFSLTV